MGIIRAKTIQRLVFAVGILVVAALTGFILRGETKREWVAYQGQFLNLSQQKILEQVAASAKAGDSAEKEKWEKRLMESKAEPIKLHQVFIPNTNIQELCTSCHLGINNPLFATAPEPFRTHPGEILQQHKPEKFGCTVCHHGQGVGTTTNSAHGLEETWYNPLIPHRYLQATCIGCHETSYGLAGADKFEAGRVAFEKYGCYDCHSARGFENLLKFAPTFDGFGQKLANEKWMLSWLKQPDKMRPSTLMPTFKLTDDEIRDITAFILSIKSEQSYPKVDLKPASANEGKALFTDLGCKSCHSDKKDEGSLTRRVPNLSDAGTKLNPNWLFEYLKDPKAYNPDTRMPKLDITDTDRLNLTAYLMSLRDNADIVKSETLSTEGASVKNGEKLVQLQGCYGCHKMKAFEKAPLPGVEVAEVAKKALDELPFGNSQVPMTKWDWIYNKIKTPKIYETPDMPLKMPEFKFEDGEVENLTVFYFSNTRLNLPESYMLTASANQLEGQAGERMVTEYNCRGCHMFTEDTKPRIDQYIELKTYVPPRLVGEGEKVQPQWAFQYLTKPVPMRPWLKMRMPTFSFSYQQVEDIINYFSVQAASPENARLPYVVLPQKEEIPKLDRDMGEYRIGFDKCMQCHPISLEGGLPQDVKLEDLSINLMLAKNRLRFEWIKNFLRNPDKYAGAGTKMPFIYYSPEGAPRVSDAEMWIDLVSKYLMIMEKVPEPRKIEPEQPKQEEDIFSDY